MSAGGQEAEVAVEVSVACGWACCCIETDGDVGDRRVVIEKVGRFAQIVEEKQWKVRGRTGVKAG